MSDVYLNYSSQLGMTADIHKLVCRHGKPLSPAPVHASMCTIPHHALVFVLAYSFISLVFATLEFQKKRTSPQSEFQVLGPVAQLNIVNKDIAPDGFLRSLGCVKLAYRLVLTFSRTVLAGGTFPGPLIVAKKVKPFRGVSNCWF